jgi:hypothetical protein
MLKWILFLCKLFIQQKWKELKKYLLLLHKNTFKKDCYYSKFDFSKTIYQNKMTISQKINVKFKIGFLSIFINLNLIFDKSIY